LNARQSATWRWPWLYRYGVAALAVAAAIIVRFWLSEFLASQPFATFFLATLLVVVIAGPGPGLAATFLSAGSAVYFFIEPVGHLWIRNGNDAARFLIFMTISLGMCALSETLRRARQATMDAQINLAKINAYMEAEATLRASEAQLALANERFAAALEASPVVVFEQDRDLRILWVHNSTFGYTTDEIIGKTEYDLFEHREDAERLVAIKQRSMATGVALREETFAWSNGQLRHFDLHVQPRRAMGEVIGVLCAAVDITERKQAEDRLRRNDLRLRIAVDAAYVISFEWNIQLDEVRRFISTDPALPSTPEDAPGSFEAVRQAVHPDDRQLFTANVRAALESAEGRYESEFRIVRPDGQIAWLYERGRVERDAEGRPAFLIGLSQDITDRRRIEEALRAADQRKDEFLATLAHELRNPLAPLRNAVRVLRRDAAELTETERGELFAMFDRQIEHLVRLVDDLLEVSRITRGKIELRPEKIDLAAILRNAIETSRPAIEGAGHHLLVETGAETLVLNADPVRLAQVFSNLLNNAAKYTEPGGTIWITVERRGPDVVVCVRDSGVGIPPEMLPRVFDLFTQIDRTLGRAQGGIGIGLALVRNLVEMHHGSVEAHSEGLGHGTSIVVRLPLVADADVEQSGPGNASTRPKVDRRILVIDDDHDVADSFVIFLRTLGATAQAAYSGAEGLESLRRFRPDIIFLDIGMPRLDGYETARLIRQLPEGANVVLVALTGWGQEQIHERARAAGFDYHLTKPADLDELETLLASLER